MNDKACDCETALENVYLFIDREIENASAEEIRVHLESCSNCLSEYDFERMVRILLTRSCSEVAPEPLRDRVLVSIRQEILRIQTNQRPQN